MGYTLGKGPFSFATKNGQGMGRPHRKQASKNVLWPTSVHNLVLESAQDTCQLLSSVVCHAVAVRTTNEKQRNKNVLRQGPSFRAFEHCTW